jgi:hypothetical protein
MKNVQATLTVVLCLSSTVGCSFYARGPDDYRKVTRELLETKNENIVDCYKSELTANKSAKGKVVVRFEVEAKTGNLVKVKVVEKKSDADENLQKCVLSALEGLKLKPADQRTGQATFEWEFAQAKF